MCTILFQIFDHQNRLFFTFDVCNLFYYFFFEKSKMSLDNETVIVPPCNLSKNAPVNFAYYVYNHKNAMGPIAIAYFFLKSYLKCNM